MRKAYFFFLLIGLALPSAFAQNTYTGDTTVWQHFVNVDFEFSIPVSKTNLRPVIVPKEASVVKNMLGSVEAFDLMEYRGANEAFYCTIQLTAFVNDMNIEGVSTKLLQQLKGAYSALQNKEVLHEGIERVGSQMKVVLVYKGEKEYSTIIMYINERRVIALFLSDTSEHQKWSKQFLDSFKII